MNQILDYGYWSDYSCAARPWAMGFWAITGAIVFSVITMHSIVTRLPATQLRWAIVAYGTISLLVLPVIIIIPALLRTTTMIFIDGNEIVRTGCRLGKPYEERSPLKDVKSKFIELSSKAIVDELHLEWPHQKSSAIIRLNGNQHLGNLAILTPDAMTQYVKKLQESGRIIPAPLRVLAKPQR